MTLRLPTRVQTGGYHPAALSEERLLEECRMWRQRRSGPGGQHRNKVETAIVIEHVPTGIRATASERRSQEQNRRVALVRLRVQLAVHARTPLESLENYGPSSLWSSRRIDRRMPVSRDHDDFPALLAEALDVLQAAQFKLPLAAAALGITTSQLSRFLVRETAALALVNEQRLSRGLRACRP
jgi:hypothetical protein